MGKYRKLKKELKRTAKAKGFCFYDLDGSLKDVACAMNLGACVFEDVPIIIAVTPGFPISEKLAKVADRIVEAQQDRRVTLARARRAFREFRTEREGK